MNTRLVTIVAVIIGLGTIGALLLYAGVDRERNEQREENKQKISMTELPAAVQKTIQDSRGGETVSETAKESEGGKAVYDVEVQKSGGEKVVMKVTEDGKLMEVGKEEDDND